MKKKDINKNISKYLVRKGWSWFYEERRRFQVWFGIAPFVSRLKLGFLQCLQWSHRHESNLFVIQAPILSLLITSRWYLPPWILVTNFSGWRTGTALHSLRSPGQFNNLILPWSYVDHCGHGRRGTCSHFGNTRSWNTDLCGFYLAEGGFVYRYWFD